MASRANKFRKQRFVNIISCLVLLGSAGIASAGIGSVWYGFYRTSGGLIVSLGPFQTQVDCMVARYDIPQGATWLGCRQ